MNHETIARILSIEQEATRIRADAQIQAAHAIEEVEKAASALREQALDQACKQAEQIIAEGREAAQAERARIIDQAEAEADHAETVVAQHLDRAVRFVLDQVVGHK